jgi:hyperosmotically inducible periplasmic protein
MRISILVVAIAAALGATACKSKSEHHAADNTAQNSRDKSAVPTADQAGQGKPDVDLAKQIRKAIVDDNSLSTNAHNCKVIVKDGVVTLGGPVASTDERVKVERIAAGIAGSTKIVNQLEATN